MDSTEPGSKRTRRETEAVADAKKDPALGAEGPENRFGKGKDKDKQDKDDEKKGGTDI